ncbi:hypothetical protein PVK06_022306 [Gossypium arboreum]|uniref:Uncharacterized protein n=1 Tax=Gossypium arboreum TaxID=29729 RepID=A0ABR0P818_GOSAR|nr:hypothetical protein PVK06_022306 [Gossypium arboreum]
MVRDCSKKSVFYAIEGDDEPNKAMMRLSSIVHSVKANRVKKNEKKPVKCLLYCGLHKMWGCLERSKLFVVTKEDEAKLERNFKAWVDDTQFYEDEEGSQEKCFCQYGISDLFISEKVVGKLGLLVSKLAKKIDTVNSKKVSTMREAQRVKLQIDKWKDEDFKVIHLDDYDFVLDLNFLNNINPLLVPFTDCILDTRQQQCIVSMSRDTRNGTIVLSAIQLAKDVLCGGNIDFPDRSATKTSLEMLEG